MGKVEESRRPVDEVEAESDQGIDRSCDDAIDDELRDDGHFGCGVGGVEFGLGVVMRR